MAIVSLYVHEVFGRELPDNFEAKIYVTNEITIVDKDTGEQWDIDKPQMIVLMEGEEKAKIPIVIDFTYTELLKLYEEIGKILHDKSLID